MESKICIAHFMVTPLEQRCSVITNTQSGETIIVDGGGDSNRIIQWIDNGIGEPDYQIGQFDGTRKVTALLNTHAHFDHSGHIPYFKKHYELEWWLHEDDFYLQSLVQQSAARFGISIPKPAVAENTWEHGEMHTFAGFDFEILHTPGHSLGSCSLRLINSDGADHLFCGDALFRGSIGRTDLPNSGGDMELLLRMIKQRLLPLSDDTVVHPGHGPMTEIGIEKRTNPFLTQGFDPSQFMI
tara:strand:- start:58 stop:780 length:723 start_codon:yes stop_codon:yes gene_type:complete